MAYDPLVRSGGLLYGALSMAYDPLARSDSLLYGSLSMAYDPLVRSGGLLYGVCHVVFCSRIVQAKAIIEVLEVIYDKTYSCAIDCRGAADIPRHPPAFVDADSEAVQPTAQD